MVFGEKITDAFVKHERTYHYAPHLDMRPFPDGPLDLGTIVQDTRDFFPLNHGADRVYLPDDERYSNNREGIYYNASRLAKGEVSFMAKMMSRILTMGMGLGGMHGDNSMYKIDSIDTAYFYPDPLYISKCVELVRVREYIEGSGYTAPVYLVTGLKIARGATVVNTHEDNIQAGATVEATVPPVVSANVDAGLEATAHLSRERRVAAECTQPASFIIGIQVQKLYFKRKNLFIKDKVLKNKKFAPRRRMFIAGMPAKKEEDEGFVVGQLGEEEMEGMQHVDIDGELWLLPSDMD